MAIDKAKVLGCLQEISNSLTRIEAERDLIKEWHKFYPLHEDREQKGNGGKHECPRWS